MRAQYNIVGRSGISHRMSFNLDTRNCKPKTSQPDPSPSLFPLLSSRFHPSTSLNFSLKKEAIMPSHQIEIKYYASSIYNSSNDSHRTRTTEGSEEGSRHAMPTQATPKAKSENHPCNRCLRLVRLVDGINLHQTRTFVCRRCKYEIAHSTK